MGLPLDDRDPSFEHETRAVKASIEGNLNPWMTPVTPVAAEKASVPPPRTDPLETCRRGSARRPFNGQGSCAYRTLLHTSMPLTKARGRLAFSHVPMNRPKQGDLRKTVG